jgi:hypothetical protein
MLFKLLGTKLDLSTAYHPETDGQTELVNRWLEDALCAYVNAAQDDWDLRLTPLEFAYNDKRHASIGFSPFYLNSGRHPRTPTALLAEGGKDKVQPQDHAFVSRMRHDLVTARANLERA